jgi:asparagine synthase (glutamine-hydrolysing)
VCGIVGYSTGRRGARVNVLRSALEAIHHRGPDDQGIFQSDSVCLGATRLSILDLEHGQQPFYSPDGDLVVVFNGEISNYRDLKADLASRGHSFTTNCDTEVVVHALMEWGTECLPKFRGMFAIAAWWEREKRLVLARDPMGIKPLYYCAQDGAIYFGSEVKCILAHPEIGRTISLAGLNCYLGLNYVPAPYTLIDGIVKLRPGHLLEWKRGAATVQPYYAERIADEPVALSLPDACDKLDELLGAALREHLIADVPVGIWLSGGIDSATVLHYASQQTSATLRTFSITFRGRSFDETDRSRQLSRLYGTRHFEFDLSDSCDLAGVIEQIPYYSDEPSADAGAVPVWFLAKMTRPEATVVLSGEGLDELFAGYITHRADKYAAIARHVPRVLRHTLLSLISRLPASNEKISLEYKLKRFLQGSLLDPGQAHVYWNGTFSEQEKGKWFLHANLNVLAPLLHPMRTAPRLRSWLDFDQSYFLPDDILYKVDRMSMAHSVEVRPPFLDLRVVEFTRSLPENFLLRGNTSKYLLRRLMADKLPASVLHGPKIGLDIPIHEWFRGPLRSLLLDTVCFDAIQQTGLFRWQPVQQILREHLERKANWGYHLWGLLTLLLWMKRWKVKTSPEELFVTAMHTA